MDQMQSELQAAHPLLRIRLVGINEPNQESGNANTSNGRDIPWLQDVDSDGNGRGDATMDTWQMAFRDVFILDGSGRKVGVYNLNQHSLAVPANYATFKDMLIDAAMTSQKPWQNSANSLDVDGNQVVIPLDVLRLVNVLNAEGPHELPPPEASQSPPPYLDVNGDGYLTPADALQVINWLNGPNSAGAEAESPDASWPADRASSGVQSIGEIVGGITDAELDAPRSSDNDAARIKAIDQLCSDDLALIGLGEAHPESEDDGWGLWLD